MTPFHPYPKGTQVINLGNSPVKVQLMADTKHIFIDNSLSKKPLLIEWNQAPNADDCFQVMPGIGMTISTAGHAELWIAQPAGSSGSVDIRISCGYGS